MSKRRRDGLTNRPFPEGEKEKRGGGGVEVFHSALNASCLGQ